MIPKRAKELIEPTAEKTGLDKQLVEDMVFFYWAKIREALVQGKSHNVFVEGLGTFSAMPRRIEEVIKKYDEILTHVQPTTFRKCEIIQSIKKKKQLLEDIKSFIAEDCSKKLKVNEKKYGKEITRSLGGPEENS